jgi:regulator of replication initiation timing
MIEVNLHKIADVKARGIVQRLVEEVRFYRLENARLTERLKSEGMA